MTDLYRRVEINNGGRTDEPVQFAAIYVLKWRPEWGRPDFMLAEAEEDSRIREFGAQLADVRDNLRLARDTAHELSARNEALERVVALDTPVAVAVEEWVGALGLVSVEDRTWGELADAFRVVCDAVNARRASLAALDKGEGR